jgi:hypothetical protein
MITYINAERYWQYCKMLPNLFRTQTLPKMSILNQFIKGGMPLSTYYQFCSKATQKSKRSVGGVCGSSGGSSSISSKPEAYLY